MGFITDQPASDLKRDGRRLQSGFTLLELLIAVAIFALIGLAGYKLLNSVIRTYEHTREHSDSFSQLQKAVSVIGQDLKQLSRRPIRDELGDPFPAFAVNYRGGLPLEFTRSADWLVSASPHDGTKVSNGFPLTGVKQRVGYRLQDGELQRLLWPVLDRAQDTKPHIQVLLTGVTHFNIRVTAEGTWQVFWPVENQQGVTDLFRLPDGIEIRFNHKTYGAIRRVFAWTGI
ncbi:type II secretion system minor pseudopilin GspJ [Oceanospirillum linum]|uniref:Type II secretion system protein J n=1 Tax=Oceanospirillum linum TaxID=966 RepID=A0A1T1HD23_OCELI|nr:type II secretion system minor pseudopilin GspJ [Oceanospirillum linum]OOV87630.1 type II secretion system protein GspJ [Oceanospirillum linum]SEF94385.1 general secretion pathway protein J [Oleiphilus messinensis]SMP11892.1 general secretion pathway protein J [Oceanospirillum linum]